MLKLVFGSLRVAEEEEVEGLDLSQHSESAYSGGGVGSSVTGESFAMATAGMATQRSNKLA